MDNIEQKMESTERKITNEIIDDIMSKTVESFCYRGSKDDIRSQRVGYFIIYQNNYGGLDDMFVWTDVDKEYDLEINFETDNCVVEEYYGFIFERLSEIVTYARMKYKLLVKDCEIKQDDVHLCFNF